MQIGDREQFFVGPIKRARWIGHERRAGDGDFMSRAPARRLQFWYRICADGVMSG